MCKFCGYATQPGYPGDVHVDCAKKRIVELERDIIEIQYKVHVALGELELGDGRMIEIDPIDPLALLRAALGR